MTRGEHKKTIDATIVLDPRFDVAPVNPRLFGSFVEHMGRCVYTGIYEPGHPTADAQGYRGDVLDLVRELGVTTIRYPGGNFVSSYRWEDGIGPVQDRPERLDLAWHSRETNAFGLHEFMGWAKKADVETMMAVNLGTRGIQDALDLLEYANLESGTTLSRSRVANGAENPFGIRIWCLGNEMDGPWQVGHKTATEYGRLAAETARAMRLIDPQLELVVCGSSSSSMPTFGSWEAEVLEHCYDQVDYISCHAYYEPENGDIASFLASGADMDYFIDSVVATADHVAAKLRTRKQIKLSFDEWNVWYLTRYQGLATPTEWATSPRVIEDCYTVADAVVVGGLLISLLRHSDRVTAASLAQLVNVIAPIMTEPAGPAWRQTIFHPFALTARHARGRVLRVEPQCATLTTDRYGQVKSVDAVATYNEHNGEMSLFMVNRSLTAAAETRIVVNTADHVTVLESVSIAESDHLTLTNDRDHPDRVRPQPLRILTESGSSVRTTLPPASWALIRIGTR